MFKEKYLLFIRDVLTGVYNWRMVEQIPVKHPVLRVVNFFLGIWGLEIYRDKWCEFHKRMDGSDQPENAETMIGIFRMNNLKYCLGEIFRNKIEGDIIECGVWRGGASIYMKAILMAYDEKRTLWLADSFAGLPKPDEKYSVDKGDIHHKQKNLSVSLEQVKSNFGKYYLLDDDVKFIEGFFEKTLPNAPIEKLALLRIDADMYGSTIQCLENLYHKVVQGGFVIIDDYALKGCKQAVDDFRKKNNITNPIIKIDWTGIYWRK